MRILQVRFKNLNSLAGEWQLDFEHPAYTSDGIFAITGTTGAGKSTLLDAICLALYGRTPRLDKVNKSTNEIMSRRTGECFAEVTFATRAGRYRCHWSQHRARQQADNDLQQPKHEIADAATGAILESKIRDVAARIEQITGMDYERFTRSMLLAQGRFAEFLSSAPDQRAPVLEQITGTRIYSDISIAVHERRSAEQRNLDTLQAALDGLKMLSAAEEEALLRSRDELTAAASHSAGQIDELRTALQWQSDIAALTAELQTLAQQQQELDIRQRAFAPGRAQLQRVKRTQPLIAAFADLRHLRSAQLQDQQLLDTCQQQLPEFTAALDAATAREQIAALQLQQARQQLTVAQPTLKKVRELDVQAHQQQQHIDAAQRELLQQQQTLQQLQARRNDDQHQLASLHSTLAHTAAQLTHSAAAAGLAAQLPLLTARVRQLGEHEQHRRNLLAAHTAQQQTCAHDEQALTLASGHMHTAEMQVATTRAELDAASAELSRHLQGQTLPHWQTQRQHLSEQRQLLRGLQTTAITLRQQRQTLRASQQRQRELQAVHSDLETRTRARQQLLDSQQQHIATLEQNLLLLNAVASFDEARQDLVDGEHCPLCGALEHPYAAGNLPRPDATRVALEEARTAQASTRTEQQQQLHTLNTSAGELAQLAAAGTELQAHIASAEQALSASVRNASALHVSAMNAAALNSPAAAPLQLDADADDLAGQLGTQLDSLEQQLTRLQQVIDTATALTATGEQLRQQLSGSETRRHEAQLAARDAQHQLDSARQRLQQLEQDGAAVRALIQREQEQLQADLQDFFPQLPAPADLSHSRLQALLGELEERSQHWQTLQQQKQQLDQQIAALTLQSAARSEQIASLQQQCTQQEQTLLAQRSTHQQSLQQRRALLGERSADAEEARLTGALEQAGADHNHSREQVLQCRHALDDLHTRQRDTAAASARRQSQLAHSAADFDQRCRAQGFTDEADFSSACLPAASVNALEMEAAQLDSDSSNLQARQQDRRQRLQQQQSRALSQQTLPALEASLAEWTARHADTVQRTGAIHNQLEQHRQLLATHAATAIKRDAQTAECARWNLLHDLIGSADGKKFRNFAQGLTFELMVAHANRQLQKMTDRYVLIRDASQPLDLNVIDQYQAGQVRSTRNLSGGESFIVSLALALGLSGMASNNVRVDSLFLDEGFGTLDEDALETALDTLASLQQDGKLIGVISHVQALKERIGTRIQVSAAANGRSTLSGPGCSRIGAG